MDIASFDESFYIQDCMVSENLTFHKELAGFAELISARTQPIEDMNMTVTPVILWDKTKPKDENAAACAFQLNVSLPHKH